MTSGRISVGSRVALGFGLLVVSVVAPASAASPVVTDAPVSVFAELDGQWKGEFVGYTPDGRELYRIQVEQTYETVDRNTQTVSIRDVAADGTVTTGVGKNLARRLPDGSLELRCIVNKSTGDRVEHRGRLVRGADGAQQLVWSSETPGRRESFREVVRHDGTKAIYEINGTGLYGTTLMVMHGIYRRVHP